MTGYVVLPPGHVTLACLHVLPSEVPENVCTLGLNRITNDKIEFMDVLMKERRPTKTGATLAAAVYVRSFPKSRVRITMFCITNSRSYRPFSIY